MPAAREPLVIVSVVGATVIDSVAVFVCSGLLLSCTLTVKLDVPLAEGVPEITPPEESVNPAGSVPELSTQEYGDVPPLTVSVAV